jgi:hypothetical protein
MPLTSFTTLSPFYKECPPEKLENRKLSDIFASAKIVFLNKDYYNVHKDYYWYQYYSKNGISFNKEMLVGNGYIFLQSTLRFVNTELILVDKNNNFYKFQEMVFKTHKLPTINLLSLTEDYSHINLFRHEVNDVAQQGDRPEPVSGLNH